MNLTKYNELKVKADKLKAKADRVEGALEQLLLRLKNEFECDTIQEAEELLEQLMEEEAEAEENYEKEYKAFNSKWGEKLEEMV